MLFTFKLRKACAAVLFALVCLPAAELSAGTVHVPGDYGSIQAAINAVPNDTVIMVYAGPHPPFTVTKPLVIIGSPSVVIDNTDVGPMFGAQDPNITLSGPGYGRLVLANLELKGTANLSMMNAMGSRIIGGGFEHLRVSDCQLDAPQGIYATGLYQGKHGISTSVTTVVLTRSSVTGGTGGTDGPFYPHPVPAHSGDGIHAPGKKVVVLDSTVTGGDAPLISFQYGYCPGTASIVTGGGDGVVAGTAFYSNSTVVGGPGESIYCQNSDMSWSLLGQSPDGAPFVAGGVHAFANHLWASSDPVSGSVWGVYWQTTTGGPTLLAVGYPGEPFWLGGRGWLFMDPSIILLNVVPGGLQVMPISIGTDPNLIGQSFVMQLLDPATGLTRPLVGTVRP